MRIQFKCSCGAEAMWENDDDSEVGTMNMIDLTDRWHMDHAKCRDAARPEPAKGCEHTMVWQSRAPVVPGGREITVYKCTKCGTEEYFRGEQQGECEHDWHHELVGPDPSGESVAVDTCRKCGRKEEVGHDLF